MPTVSPGSVIYGSDYNTIQSLVTQILGSGNPYGPTGSGDLTYGYNQSLQSSLVSAGQVITSNQWSNLTVDVNKIYKHQNGANWASYASQISNEAVGQVVTAANYNNLFNLMTSLVATRTTVSANQLSLSTLGSSTYNSTWGVGDANITNDGSVQFASAAAMQYFFNQGGTIRLAGVGPNQSGSSQDSTWQTALSAFSYAINLSEFSALTTSLVQRYSQTNQPSPYSGNFIRVSVSIAGNTINWRVIYEDVHNTAYSDSVSAGAGYTVYANTAIDAVVGTAPTAVLTNSWTATTITAQPGIPAPPVTYNEYISGPGSQVAGQNIAVNVYGGQPNTSATYSGSSSGTIYLDGSGNGLLNISFSSAGTYNLTFSFATGHTRSYSVTVTAVYVPTLNASAFASTNYTSGGAFTTKNSYVQVIWDASAAGTQSWSASVSGGLTVDTGLSTSGTGGTFNNSNTNAIISFLGPHSGGTVTLTVSASGYYNYTTTVTVPPNATYVPYTAYNGYMQEFGKSTRYADLVLRAQTIFYSSNAAFQSAGGLRYGLYRRGEVGGCDFWASAAIANGWSDQQAVDAFFWACDNQPSVGLGGDHDRCLTPNKSFVSGTGYGDFDDRP